MTLDFDSLSQAGTMIGSAAVIVMDDRCCMVQLGVRVSQFYEHESCGKCTPCRVGTRWLTQILKKIEAGQGTHPDLDLLLDVGERINGTCLCPLGDSDAIAVASYVAKFREEFSRTSTRAAVRSTASPRWTGSSRRRTSTKRTSARRRSPGRSRWLRERDGQGHDRRPRDRGREGHGARRDRRLGGSRSPSSATSRGSPARRRAGCASSRSKDCRSSRPDAR